MRPPAKSGSETGIRPPVVYDHGPRRSRQNHAAHSIRITNVAAVKRRHHAAHRCVQVRITDKESPAFGREICFPRYARPRSLHSHAVPRAKATISLCWWWRLTTE